MLHDTALHASYHRCVWEHESIHVRDRQTEWGRYVCMSVCVFVHACIESHHLELISVSNCTGLVVWSQCTCKTHTVACDPHCSLEIPSYIRAPEKSHRSSMWRKKKKQSGEDDKQDAAIWSNDSRFCSSRQVKPKQFHVEKPPCCERESAPGDQVIFVCEVAVFSPLSSLLSVRSTL